MNLATRHAPVIEISVLREKVMRGTVDGTVGRTASEQVDALHEHAVLAVRSGAFVFEAGKGWSEEETKGVAGAFFGLAANLYAQAVPLLTLQTMQTVRGIDRRGVSSNLEEDISLAAGFYVLSGHDVSSVELRNLRFRRGLIPADVEKAQAIVDEFRGEFRRGRTDLEYMEERHSREDLYGGGT